MAIWAVVETYYKHSEFKLHIFYSDMKLYSFLESEIQERIEEKCSDMELSLLIKRAIEIGEEIVDNEEGWGIREIVEV